MKKYVSPTNIFESILFLFTLYFCSLPVLSVIIYGIGGQGRDITGADCLRILSLLKNSILLAFGVTIAAVLLGVIATFALHRIEFKNRGLLRTFMLLPLVNPAFVGSISFIMLFGKRGLITHTLLGLSISPFGWHGIFFLQLIGSTTLAYLVISGAVRNSDVSIEDAARSLGASEKAVLLKITLPVMMPEISAAALLVFLGSMADFTTPLVIGGNYRTLAADLYILITGRYDMKLACLSGVVLLIPCFSAFIAQRYFSNKKRYLTDQTVNTSIEYVHVKPWVKRVLLTAVSMMLFLFIINILFVFAGAFTVSWGSNYTFTLAHFKTAFSLDAQKYVKPLINSIILSVVAGIGSSLIGVLTAYGIQRGRFRFGRLLDTLAMMPAAVPGILFGIGYLVTFKYPLFGIGRFIFPELPPLILLGTSMIVYLVCIARNVNLSMKNCYALLEHIDPDIENAAVNLGASKIQTFGWVVLPLLKDAFINSYIKVFSATMTSLGVIIFLLMPKNKVIVQVLFQSMTGGLSLGVPAVLALALSLVTLLLMLLFNVLAYGKGAWGRLRRFDK